MTGIGPNRLGRCAMALDRRHAGASADGLEAQEATATKSIKDGNPREVVADDREERLSNPTRRRSNSLLHLAGSVRPSVLHQ